MKKIKYLMFLLALFMATAAFSQQKKVTLSLKNVTVKTALEALKAQSGLSYWINANDVDMQKVISVNLKSKTVEDALKTILQGQDVRYQLSGDHIVISKATRVAEPKQENVAPSGEVRKLIGKVTDEKGQALPGVTVLLKGTTIGTITDVNGSYTLNNVLPDKTVVFSFIGMLSQDVKVGNQDVINVMLSESTVSLNEVVAIGYGVQKKSDLTGAIASVDAKDMGDIHGGSTVSTSLAGVIAGVSFRQSDARPGSSAEIQIRNMGDPLYVIDGIEEDAGQFNNLAPNDIQSITVLKDASAAIYGVKAANGVVVVTTKRGERDSKPTFNIDAYTGWENMTTYPKVGNAYQWNVGKVEADINQTGTTAITPAQLALYKAGTAPGYQSFNWAKFIIKPNMPQTSVNINTTGGSKNINFYLSYTSLNQDAYYKQYYFNRQNIQGNIDANITDNFKVGMSVNGRIESRVNPGVPGGDDYWEPRFAVIRNTPMERPYANDNPLYLNEIGHDSDNAGLWTYANSGKFTNIWYVLQTNFNAEYQLPVKGLSLKGTYSYYYANNQLNNHEFTFDTYTYNPTTSTYAIAGGSSNPWQERGTELITDVTARGEIDYKNSFGLNHIDAVFAAERDMRQDNYTWLHDVPALNTLTIVQFPTMDTYNDTETATARVGYIGRISYDYDNKYYIELSARRDASSLFAPGKRWGFFPSVSGGWRISSEKFYQSIPNLKNVLNDLKIRASYGVLGDDNNGVSGSSFVYDAGYTYPSGATAIFNGNPVLGARDRGLPEPDISWLVSKITDVGADFSFFNSKLNGSVDYFYRKRTGLIGTKNDVLMPQEVGFSLPQQNINSDAQMGEEGVLNYSGTVGKVQYTVGGNVSYSRHEDLSTYNPMFGNSWDQYRNSTQNRWDGIVWGYQVVGQFKSQDQINNYPVNIDGQGNKTLLPGDLIYKDQNGDGVINQYDQRPIGYPEGQQPILNYGFQLGAKWNGFDFKADFSGGSMYTYERHYEMMWPYQNGGNLLSEFYNNSWHHSDPYDVNSPWIAGKYPALRFNDAAQSDYEGMGASSSFWLTAVNYLRLRTMELGYSIPKSLLTKIKLQQLRIYINTYNLFSIDNVSSIGVDPEIMDNNGMTYPQAKFVNVGVNISL
jgi:TonB-linked SusC/RagA family outer membrane protein